MKEDAHYFKVKNLIYSKAHSFARTSGHEIDELIAQGNLIYCQALLRYNPKKAKFITILYLSLDHGLIEYTKKLSRQLPPFEELKESLIKPLPALQERSCIFKNNLNSLPKETKEIIEILLNEPNKIYGKCSLKPKQMYSKIKQHIRLVLGYSHNKTRRTLKEMQELAYNN